MKCSQKDVLEIVPSEFFNLVMLLEPFQWIWCPAECNNDDNQLGDYVDLMIRCSLLLFQSYSANLGLLGYFKAYTDKIVRCHCANYVTGYATVAANQNGSIKISMSKSDDVADERCDVTVI